MRKLIGLLLFLGLAHFSAAFAIEPDDVLINVGGKPYHEAIASGLVSEELIDSLKIQIADKLNSLYPDLMDEIPLGQLSKLMTFNLAFGRLVSLEHQTIEVKKPNSLYLRSQMIDPTPLSRKRITTQLRLEMSLISKNNSDNSRILSNLAIDETTGLLPQETASLLEKHPVEVLEKLVLGSDEMKPIESSFSDFSVSDTFKVWKNFDKGDEYLQIIQQRFERRIKEIKDYSKYQVSFASLAPEKEKTIEIQYARMNKNINKLYSDIVFGYATSFNIVNNQFLFLDNIVDANPENSNFKIADLDTYLQEMSYRASEKNHFSISNTEDLLSRLVDKAHFGDDIQGQNLKVFFKQNNPLYDEIFELNGKNFDISSLSEEAKLKLQQLEKIKRNIRSARSELTEIKADVKNQKNILSTSEKNIKKLEKLKKGLEREISELSLSPYGSSLEFTEIQRLGMLNIPLEEAQGLNDLFRDYLLGNIETRLGPLVEKLNKFDKHLKLIIHPRIKGVDHRFKKRKFRKDLYLESQVLSDIQVDLKVGSNIVKSFNRDLALVFRPTKGGVIENDILRDEHYHIQALVDDIEHKVGILENEQSLAPTLGDFFSSISDGRLSEIEKMNCDNQLKNKN